MAFVAALATLVLIAFLLWFTFGTQRNISRGNELLRWLQGGLPALGRRTTVRWLGSSAVQLTIADAKAPYAEAQVNVVLEPRDIGFLWAWARQRGRRDFLILRGTLDAPPRFELEAGGGEGWTSRERLDRLDPSAWTRTRWTTGSGIGTVTATGTGTGTVEVAHSSRAGSDDLAQARRTWQALAAAGGGPVWRLSVRNLAPHVEVHLVPAAEPDTEGAAALCGAFAALGRLAHRDTATGTGTGTGTGT